MYTITLSDGRRLENLAVNGTNFVSKTKDDCGARQDREVMI